MARINLEDSLFTDGRFLNLIAKTGNVDSALGAVVRAFMLAQKYYLDESNDRLIPFNEWQRQLIDNSIIDVGLAEKRENGIYVVGSEEQFNWLLQRQAAGKKSAETKSEKDKNLVDDSSTTVERPLTTVNGSSTSLLFSHYSLLNTLNSKNNNIVPTSKNEVETFSNNSKNLIKILQPRELADLLPEKNKKILFELYGDADFIKREFFKIQNWLDANPKKNKKTNRGWLQFVSNWLANAWPQYQKSIPSNKAKASSVSELMDMMGWGND